MKFRLLFYVFLVSIIFLSSSSIADNPPPQVRENQKFDIDTVIDATGSTEDQTKLNWVISSQTINDDNDDETLNGTELTADTVFSDTILTNGGKLSENKNFAFDSRNKGISVYNLELEKVLTYASTEGAHLVGEEEYTLSIAGNFASSSNSIRCVFSDNSLIVIPAFCNIVSAKNTLTNVNSAQISTKGQIRSVGGIRSGAGLTYQIAVTPDENSGSGFAEGSVKTVFAGSIMEARDGANSTTWNQTAATNSWKDSTEVTGGIKNFQKKFGYTSAFLL